ncbi:MAG: transcriptional repressor [Actinobacteria bacterium]|nr:transcriptional repressor [Actinomycetota bacterium]
MAQDQALMNKSEVKVIGALKRQGKFASAQSVYQLLRKDGESTGLATVYRTLQKAAARNTVDVLRKDDGEALYRLCETGHHHHLVCTSCGKTIEVEGSSVERWANTVAKNNGFRKVSHVVELFGLCAKC